MTGERGNISIHAQNIMPIIKKWLYSDKDIFVRELISNGCDAVTKYKFLALSGEASAVSEEEFRIDVVADEGAGTLSISDNGVGMTAEEVRKYITQVAFSGAEEFLKQYAPDKGEDQTGIIGHFGLGFYSAFMVSGRVVIDTLSWQEGSQAVRWTSEDGMEYEMSASERDSRGTTITLTLLAEEADFLKEHTLRDVLAKYCAFMNVPIYLTIAGKEEASGEKEALEGKEGEEAEPKKPAPVNEVHPLWLKKPSEVEEEEYKAFYRKVFQDYEEPLFWIHLNAEYPFNMKGILYFPKLRNDFGINEGQIKLYSGQVFVADNIKEVIPEFLMLLKGVIDCPELPLNVSRSFLQNDGYVKKLSAYITRKVADRLISEFTAKREDYQRYWDDIHPFVKFGCIRDEKFYDRVKGALLFKTVDGQYMTMEEYKDAAPEGRKDTMVYTNDPKRQMQLIDLFKAQGQVVVELATMIDDNYISFLEYTAKDNGVKFVRVDAAADSLAEGGEQDAERQTEMEALFRKALGEETLQVAVKALKTEEMPAMVTVDEQSRRFADMSQKWGGGFAMPQQRTLVLNQNHPLVKWLESHKEHPDREEVAHQVADLAELARQPLEPEHMVAFLRRGNALMTRLLTEA